MQILPGTIVLPCIVILCVLYSLPFNQGLESESELNKYFDRNICHWALFGYYRWESPKPEVLKPFKPFCLEGSAFNFIPLALVRANNL